MFSQRSSYDTDWSRKEWAAPAHRDTEGRENKAGYTLLISFLIGTVDHKNGPDAADKVLI